MKRALYLNGVFEDVLLEILKSQKQDRERVFYLQPYSPYPIKQLKNNPPTPDSPLPVYISTTTQLNQICYAASIVGWEDKSEIPLSRITFLNKQVKQFQPGEHEIYLEKDEKKCINLISITNLIKLSNQLSTSNLIKDSNGEPLKTRTRSGNWSYVKSLPLLSMEKSFVQDRLHKELSIAVSESLKYSKDQLEKRLRDAPKKPENIQTISHNFKRNPDVIAYALKRANGKCEKCGNDAPFIRSKDRSPYLEVHHKTFLSKGGDDTIENALAVCPNCHKELHFGVEYSSK